MSEYGISPIYLEHPHPAVHAPARGAVALSRAIDLTTQAYNAGLLDDSVTDRVIEKLSSIRSNMLVDSVDAALSAKNALDRGQEPKEDPEIKSLAERVIDGFKMMGSDAESTARFMLRAPESALKALGEEMIQASREARQALREMMNYYAKSTGIALLLFLALWFGPDLLDKWSK